MTLNTQNEEVASRDLQCLEVWGGNTPTRTDLAVTGLHVDVFSRSWQNQTAGGDIYLVSMCACASISRFMLADVSGHGEHIAPTAQRLRKLMYQYINQPDQTRLARDLNHAFEQTSDTGRYATALLATFLPEHNQLTLCNAGHLPPLWYRHEKDHWQPLTSEHAATEAMNNLPLGVVAETNYEQYTLDLTPGDMVMFYSDGATAAVRQDKTTSELQRFYQYIQDTSDKSEKSSASRMLDTFSAQTHGDMQDDQTLIILTHTGDLPPQQTLLEKIHILLRLAGLRLGMVRD